MSSYADSDGSTSLTRRFNRRRAARAASIDSDDLAGPSLADELNSGVDEEVDGDLDLSHSQPIVDGLADMHMLAGDINLQDELLGLEVGQGHAGHPTSLGDELGFAGDPNDANTIPSTSAPTSQANLNDEQYDMTLFAQRQAAFESTCASLAESIQATDTYIMALSQSINGDDTRNMEDLGGQVALSLQESIRQRESQNRELREIDRALNNSDSVALQVSLAEVLLTDCGESASMLDSLLASNREDSSNTDSAVKFSERSSPLGHEADRQTSRSDFRTSENQPFSRRHTSSSNATALPPPGPSRRAPLPDHFAHLQTVTSSLVTSLQDLHEHTQVSNASFRESTKFLRKLKQHLSETMRELEAADRSRSWIERRRREEEEEERSVTKSESNGFKTPSLHAEVGKGRVRDWTSFQIMQFEQNLEAASSKAQELLKAGDNSAIVA